MNSIHTKPHKAREKPIGSDASREFYSLIGSISDSDWDSLLDHQVSRCDQLAITSNLIRYLKSDSSIRLNSSKVLDDWHLLALENCPEVPDEVSKVEVIPTLTRVVKNYQVGRPIPDGWDPFPAIGTYLCPRAAVMQDDDGKLVLILNREKAEARMNREMFWLGNRVDYDVRLYLSPGILIEQTISGSVVADKASFRYTDLTAAERDEAWIEGQRQAFDWAKSHPPVDMTAPKQQSESAGGIPPFAMR